MTGASDTVAARQALQTALTAAQHATADWPSDQRGQELAPLVMNLDWARVVWQGGATDTAALPAMRDLPASGKLVALINRALDMPSAADGLRLLPLSGTDKLTPLQGRLSMYNRAILQYKAQQYEECMETCRLVQSSLHRSGDGKGNNKAMSAPNSKLEAQWWESRVTVLLVRAQLAKGGNKYNKTSAEQTLQSLLQALQKQPESALRDHAVAYVMCHLPSILQTDQSVTARVALLKSLPKSWQTKRAVVATLAALYQQQGQSDEAMKLVQETGHEDALADLLLSQGHYQQAVTLYEAADLTDPIAQARYARALTFCDATKALKYWNEVRPAEVLDNADSLVAVDGAELETRPVPRLRTTTRTVDLGATSAAASDANATSSKNKKSHEAVLRRRARKREEYVAQLERRGLRRTQPDPERWLPKYERSYNRRRRQKGPHKGAQGGVSDKDAAQLDVAARQAARAAGEPASSTSTAHIAAVSSGGPSRKGGRRR